MTDEQRGMAWALGYDPDNSEHWPWSVINRLIHVRHHEGEEAYAREVFQLLSPSVI